MWVVRADLAMEDDEHHVSVRGARIAFGATLGADAADPERAGELTELGGELLALVVWFVFGAVLLPIAFDHLTVEVVVYALLSLTLVRILPVVLCMIGSGLECQVSIHDRHDADGS